MNNHRFKIAGYVRLEGFAALTMKQLSSITTTVSKQNSGEFKYPIYLEQLGPRDITNDGCPFSMEAFVKALFKDVTDLCDRSDAIDDWLNGRWEDATAYLSDASKTALAASNAEYQEWTLIDDDTPRDGTKLDLKYEGDEGHYTGYEWVNNGWGLVNRDQSGPYLIMRLSNPKYWRRSAATPNPTGAGHGQK